MRINACMREASITSSLLFAMTYRKQQGASYYGVLRERKRARERESERGREGGREGVRELEKETCDDHTCCSSEVSPTSPCDCRISSYIYDKYMSVCVCVCVCVCV
jgi:hypothetical protein